MSPRQHLLPRCYHQHFNLSHLHNVRPLPNPHCGTLKNKDRNVTLLDYPPGQRVFLARATPSHRTPTDIGLHGKPAPSRSTRPEAPCQTHEKQTRALNPASPPKPPVRVACYAVKSCWQAYQSAFTRLMYLSLSGGCCGRKEKTIGKQRKWVGGRAVLVSRQRSPYFAKTPVPHTCPPSVPPVGRNA